MAGPPHSAPAVESGKNDGVFPNERNELPLMRKVRN